MAKVGLSLVRTANEVKKFRVLLKILPVALSLMVVVTAIGYIGSILYSKFGSFTVMVDKYDNVRYGLSLSEDPNFTTGVVTLNARASKSMTNIDGATDLPADLDSINGSHNGQNYLAYTYYLKNVGTAMCDAEYYLYIANVTNELDTAIRITLYVDGVPTTYARVGADGQPEKNTTAFVSSTGICRDVFYDFEPGALHKFTVVIWIEGPDPECTNDRLGGELKCDMKIKVVNYETPTDDAAS